MGLSDNLRKNKKAAATPQKSAAATKIIEEIHEEKQKQMTVRMAESLHRKMKAKCALDGVAINEYITNLISDDLISENRLDF